MGAEKTNDKCSDVNKSENGEMFKDFEACLYDIVDFCEVDTLVHARVELLLATYMHQHSLYMSG